VLTLYFLYVVIIGKVCLKLTKNQAPNNLFSQDSSAGFKVYIDCTIKRFDIWLLNRVKECFFK